MHDWLCVKWEILQWKWGIKESDWDLLTGSYWGYRGKLLINKEVSLINKKSLMS
jgi:hypothetical protein